MYLRDVQGYHDLTQRHTAVTPSLQARIASVDSGDTIVHTQVSYRGCICVFNADFIYENLTDAKPTKPNHKRYSSL